MYLVAAKRDLPAAKYTYLADANLPGSCCFTWQLLLQLTAATLPGSCYFTWQPLLLMIIIFFIVSESCKCTFQLLMYLAAATVYLPATKYTLRMLLYLAGSIVSESWNWAFQLLMYLAAATRPFSCKIYLADATLPGSCYCFWELHLYLPLVNVPGSCNYTFQVLNVPGRWYWLLNLTAAIFRTAATVRVPSTC